MDQLKRMFVSRRRSLFMFMGGGAGDSSSSTIPSSSQHSRDFDVEEPSSTTTTTHDGRRRSASPKRNVNNSNIMNNNSDHFGVRDEDSQSKNLRSPRRLFQSVVQLARSSLPNIMNQSSSSATTTAGSTSSAAMSCWSAALFFLANNSLLSAGSSSSNTTTTINKTNNNKSILPHQYQAILGTAFNVVNSIVGPGCIVLGGAMAESGGLVSLLLILLLGLATKASCDLLIHLGLQHDAPSYEALARQAYGKMGYWVVIFAKGLYSFGSMVACILMMQDNLVTVLLYEVWQLEQYHPDDATAVNITASSATESDSYLQALEALEHSNNQKGDSPHYSHPHQHHAMMPNSLNTWVTWMLCTSLVLPLSLIRNVKVLEVISNLKVTSFVALSFIVFYLYATSTTTNVVTEETTSAGEQPAQSTVSAVSPTAEPNHSNTNSTWETWFAIKPGVWANTGTFLLAHVGQHTIHIIFQAMRNEGMATGSNNNSSNKNMDANNVSTRKLETKTSEVDDEDDSNEDKPLLKNNDGLETQQAQPQQPPQQLQPSHEQQERDWNRVTTLAISMSIVMFFCFALFPYLTFGNRTELDLFRQYYDDSKSSKNNAPRLRRSLVVFAKALLGMAMAFTFPMPLLSLREMIASLLLNKNSSNRNKKSHDEDDVNTNDNENGTATSAGREALSSTATQEAALHQTEMGQSTPKTANAGGSTPLSPRKKHTENTPTSANNKAGTPTPQQQPQRQQHKWVHRIHHVLLTVFLLDASVLVSTSLSSREGGGSSLGLVLNLNGCISGSLIACLLPALFSYQLNGRKWTWVALALLSTGMVVFFVGTYATMLQAMS